jgi:hypothetical protein
MWGAGGELLLFLFAGLHVDVVQQHVAVVGVGRR